MSLLHATCGKAGARVMRVGRVEPEEVREHEVPAMLEGGFDDACTRADNAGLVATDTLRNLVHVVAAAYPWAGRALGGIARDGSGPGTHGRQTVFMSTSEPHGRIERTVRRD